MPLETGVSADLAAFRAAVVSDLTYELTLSVPQEQAAPIPGSLIVELDLAAADRDLPMDWREDARHITSLHINGDDALIKVEKEHIVLPRAQLRRGRNRIEVEFLAGDRSLNRNPDFLYALFVPDRARTAFPVFDQPDLKASWILHLEIPDAWAAISAAPLASAERHGDRKTLHFEASDPISTYLFSFVAGAFDTLSREVNGQTMILLHRETDADKVARNAQEIFDLHEAALTWLEDYTGIPFPFAKLDIALIPAHPYGGMEHLGAIQYRAERLWLDEGASDTQRLRRASLIAHEVAHMWFGNLVTMRWFDDVWTKEVFANFMASKIVNPSFPDIDHDLNFLVDHHPGAYAIDRTAGANAIRQPLGNLNQAGQLYGPIIYDKAPIMMRQLETLLGEAPFRAGIQRYLKGYAYANATWPELIALLDAETGTDLATWSETWVETPGRPTFRIAQDTGEAHLEQIDPRGQGRLWPQRFEVLALGGPDTRHVLLQADAPQTPLPLATATDSPPRIFNADGYGYGLFPASQRPLDAWRDLDALPLAALLMNLYEQMLETGQPEPIAYLGTLTDIATTTDNQLLLNLALTQLRSIYWRAIPEAKRRALAPGLEGRLEAALHSSADASRRKIYFLALADLALSREGIDRVEGIWSGEESVADLPLAESDLVELAQLLAIKNPQRATAYLDAQLARTRNPDQLRRLAFLAPSVSAEEAVRDAFFASLAAEGNRETESWVLDALANLHHPLRVAASEDYVLPSLELLEEIQRTGDIFFPAGWLRRTLANHHSAFVIDVVDTFLGERPAYNPQLRMKIEQAADPVRRAHRLRATADASPAE